ncbi:copper amine oxidase N-terminal domain-containing protein [Paenibacillaceae bacterium WGS1546]|uniref:copper amine oxidase N-terminal domain-containing protein n=1 Tax=Cohnella sp. WGS1546 TaxID=3366810 RepID=UPI00372D4D71
MFKKTIATVIAASIVCSGVWTSQAAAAPGNDLQIIPIIVNGQKVRFPDTEPYVNTDGRTMVPVRFVSEKLGAEVTWDNSTETATIKYEGKTIQMPIGSKTVTVDGVQQELDTAAEMYEGRTMVPLRFVSEVLDSTVEWDSGAHAVKVTDANYQAKIDSGEVKLDPWGREYSKTKDAHWMRLTDLENTGFYDVTYKSPNRTFFESKLMTPNGKEYVDGWANHIREYYAAQLNVDYRTIDEKKFADTLIKNMKGMSKHQESQSRLVISDYVKWVKQKVIAKGYADPENSQVEGNENGVSMRVYFKFMVISATDTAQTFLDNWDVSDYSDSFKLEKGVWYGGYSTVVLGTNWANQKFSGYAVNMFENMFGKLTYKYEKLK